MDYTNIGFQTYFVAQEKLDLLDQLNFDAVRLGVISENVKEIEPYSRDANAALLNLSSLSWRASSLGLPKSNNPILIPFSQLLTWIHTIIIFRQV